MQKEEWIFSSFQVNLAQGALKHKRMGCHFMKQNGTLNRIISIALLLAMALSLLPVGGAAEAVTTHGYLVINNTSVNRVVNFRRQPNTNDNTNYPIARLPEYWVVEILGQEKGWYKIKANISIQGGEANYQTGYVMENFVKQMTAAEETEWLQNPTAKYQPGVTAAPIVNVTTAPAVTASPTAAQAAGTVIGYVRTVQNDVNLRESPAGKVLNESDKIQLNMVFACYAIVAYGEYDWALVQYKGKAGYIRSDCYIKTDAYGNIISGDGTPIAVLTPTPTPTANPNNNIVPGVTYGTVTTDNVFFRKSMSTSGDSWAKLPMGWQLLVLDVQVKDGITWYKVQGSIPTNPSRTYTGYIHGGFFKINESATATPTATPANSDYALVILDGVNLRQTPGGTALTAMRINTVVNVLSVPAGNTANDWYYVETSGLYGYLPATSLRVLTTAELSSYVLPAKPTVTGAPTAAERMR